MSTLRLKVQLGTESSGHNSQAAVPVLKFVYVLETPSSVSVHELIQRLKTYMAKRFGLKNVKIVHLTTSDGFLLSNLDTCAGVFKDYDHIVCVDMLAFIRESYSSLDLDDLWLDMEQHDASDDEEKYIRIGLTHMSKLFIRMHGQGAMHSLYLYSYDELAAIASEKRRDITIDRFDHTHVLNPALPIDWFVESKWEYDPVSNRTLSVICNLKIGSDDKVYSNRLRLHLDESSMSIRRGDVDCLSDDITDGSVLTDQQRSRLEELAKHIPPPKRTGPEISLRSYETLKLIKHECEGDSSIRMSVGNTNTVVSNQDSRTSSEKLFRQYVTITHIIFSKKPVILPEILQQKRAGPVEKPVSAMNINLLYQTHDGGWRECQDVAIAPIAMRNEEPNWLVDSVLNIEPDKLISITIRGSIKIKGEPGRDNQSRSRVHKSLPQPFKLKIVVTDSLGKQCSLVIEQINRMPDLPTRETFLKANQSSVSDLLAFVYADDCEVDDRTYTAVYVNSEGQLVFRSSEGSSRLYGRKSLKTMEFNAKQNHSSELLFDGLHRVWETEESKVMALFDPETYLFYAARVELATKTTRCEETIMIPIDKIK